MTKQIYITVDIEEWYHLDYLKEYNLDKSSVETIPEMVEFLDLMDELNIKVTFFTLAEVAKKHSGILKDIYKRGHEIACHGLDHELLYNKKDEQFRKEVTEAKSILDEIIGEEVIGYRASCFSMDRNKLDILSEIGFKYDSSYISFVQHPLYGSLDLSGYEKTDDLIYKHNNFLEIEIPTYKINKFNIPISGGGYMRLFPYILNKFFIKSFLKKQNSFVIYLHPFELTDISLPLKNVKLKDKFRAQVGRKNNLKKLRNILKMLREENVEFRTMKDKYLQETSKRYN